MVVMFAPDVPGYIVACDVDAHGGKGHVTLSTMQADAMRFADAGVALDYWKRPSTVDPIRDGKPNRPLTAYTVQIMTVTE